jgi:hypothetical protein
MDYGQAILTSTLLFEGVTYIAKGIALGFVERAFKDTEIGKDAKDYFFYTFIMPEPLGAIKLFRDGKMSKEIMYMDRSQKAQITKNFLKRATKKYWTKID